MENKLKFTYREKHCAIDYDKNKKEFSVVIYTDETCLHIERKIGLFHVERFSKSQQTTAFHVANRIVLHQFI